MHVNFIGTTAYQKEFMTGTCEICEFEWTEEVDEYQFKTDTGETFTIDGTQENIFGEPEYLPSFDNPVLFNDWLSQQDYPDDTDFNPEWYYQQVEAYLKSRPKQPPSN